jgi:Family of unknown function (DUF5764)
MELVEAKREYLRDLCEVMGPIMEDTFVKMYQEAITRSNRMRDQTVKTFIVLLEEIANWNNSIIQTHTKEYETACAYFSELLGAVFVCHIKILSSVRTTKEPKKLEFVLPSNADFIHECIQEAGLVFAKHPKIFRTEDPLARTEAIQKVCCTSVEKVINRRRPTKEILMTYIGSTSRPLDFGTERQDDPAPDEFNEPEPTDQPPTDQPHPDENPEGTDHPLFGTEHQPEPEPEHQPAPAWLGHHGQHHGHHGHHSEPETRHIPVLFSDAAETHHGHHGHHGHHRHRGKMI